MPYVDDVAWIRKGKGLTFISDSIEAMVGYTAKEVMSMTDPISTLVMPSDAQRKLANLSIA